MPLAQETPPAMLRTRLRHDPGDGRRGAVRPRTARPNSGTISHTRRQEALAEGVLFLVRPRDHPASMVNGPVDVAVAIGWTNHHDAIRLRTERPHNESKPDDRLIRGEERLVISRPFQRASDPRE
jgi:hypothetical protein